MSIQDISCLGKCSLTVALPVISAMGVETSIIPTAVLSTHTQFNGFTFRDLTSDMELVKDHWVKEGFKFDAIYTGYLGSKEQIKIVTDYFDTFKSEDTVIIVDPAMADNGVLYTGFKEDFARSMASLCQKADVILPNISEAAFMLGEPYPGEEADEETIKSLLVKLSTLGARYNIITGTTLSDGLFGFIGYDADSKEFFKYGTKKIDIKSHGTGDVFASAFTGAVMNDKTVFEALKIAADFSYECIKDSYEDETAVNYAVNFETQIPYLLKRIGKV